jgi:hypothetical protein
MDPLVVRACRAIPVLETVRQEDADVLRGNIHEVGQVVLIDSIEEVQSVLFGKGVFASGEHAFFRVLLGCHGAVSCEGKIPAF